ncbi:MAG: ABC transporter permease [Anaerolineales bacterium]
MKALLIAWKDTLTRLRDRKALVTLLAAPLIISALIGLAFGNINFGGSEAPVTDLAVILVNEDSGQLGQVYEEVLTSEALAELLDVTQMDDLDAARRQIEEGAARVVVHIPAGFSDQVLPEAPGASVGRATVQIYTDPTSTVAPLIVQSILEQISAGISTVNLAAQISAQQAGEYAAILGPQLAQLAQVLPEELSREKFDFETQRLILETSQVGEAQQEINAFAYFVPGMAVYFLMFSMFTGARSILDEENSGTLPRLMTTPTPLGQIILGKMGGTFLIGLLQFGILMLASRFIFQLSWGTSLPGLALIVILTVFAASGLGALLTTFTRNQLQANVIGSTVALVFGALGGSFFPMQGTTGILDVASKLTVNRWSMDALTKLTVQNAGFSEILTEATILAAIGLVTYLLAIPLFQRRFVK